MDPNPHHHQPVPAAAAAANPSSEDSNSYVVVDRMNDDALPRSPSFASAEGEDNADVDAKSAEEENDIKVSFLSSLSLSETAAERDALKAEVSQLRALLMEREVEFARQSYEADFEKQVYKGKIRDVKAEMEQLGFCFQERENQFEKQIKSLKDELEVFKEKIREMESDGEQKDKLLEETNASVGAVKGCLVRVIEMLDDAKDGSDGNRTGVEKEVVVEEGGEGTGVVGEDVMSMAREVERKVGECQEMRKRERRQLEGSVVSLTEENRDINTLLRIALAEKESVEKRLKGTGEQKRVPLLQLGLHKVGFGFMMGSGQSEAAAAETYSVSNASSKSDGSECEEEVVSLVCLLIPSIVKIGNRSKSFSVGTL